MLSRSISALAFIAPIVLAALTLAPAALAKPYKGAEVYTPTGYLHGRVEMRMRMIRGSGLLSTFFTYKNGSEVAGTLWEEIDIEVFGKDPASWQSNIITGSPRTTSEQVHTAATSLADDYHTYTLEWTPDYVAWSLDGVEVRRTEGAQVAALVSPQSLRFNVWSSESAAWVGEFDETVLPQYQFVNWIKYYRYEGGAFVLDWTDDFDAFNGQRWARGNWTFDGNRVDLDPANAIVQDGTLILAITREGETGFTGVVPVDPAGNAGAGGVPATGGAPATGGTATGGDAPATGGSSGDPASGGTATGGTATGGLASGGSASGGAPPASGGAGPVDPGDDGSCSVTATGAHGRPALALLVLGLSSLVARRRRRR